MTKKISALCLIASMLLLNSCSLFNGKGIFAKGDQGETKSVSQPTTEIATETATQETAVAPAKKTPTGHQASSQDANLEALEGEWQIVQAGKIDIERDDNMPYVNFDTRDGRFYASNGCNILNGNFKYSNKEMEFSNVLTTLQHCPDIKYELPIRSVLCDGSKVQIKLENKGHESYVMMYKSGAKLMTLRRHNLEQINGKWYVTEVRGQKIAEGKIDIFFDIPELLAHGNTGCNYFNGAIYIDANKPSAISFSQLGVTQRMCENSATETALLVALEETMAYSLSGKDTLYLNDENGTHIITLRRAEAE